VEGRRHRWLVHAIAAGAAPILLSSLSPCGSSLPSGGGTAAIDVTATSALCEWSARSEADWLVVREGATGRGNARVVVEASPSGGPTRTAALVIVDQSVGSGTGSGSVQFSVPALAGPTRSGTIGVASHTFTVTQQSGCAVALGSTSQDVPAAGGTGAVRVDTPAGCSWQAVSNAQWITIQSGASGSGGGEVRFQVAANTGAARRGTLTIGGQTFTINQSAGCTFALSSGSANIPAAGGAASVDVIAPAGCAWTATSDPAAPWLRITAGATGTGNGKVDFGVDLNAGPPRSTTLAIAGLAFTVNQAGGCTYNIAPTSQSIPAVGGTGSIAVTTSAGCGWNATTTGSWISIPAGANRSGSGSVEFSVAPSSGPARTGTISVAGQSFTVEQASGCTFSIAPTSQSFEVVGGSGTIAVTAGDGCTWMASSPVDWITIMSGASGSGPASVTFKVAANGGAARSATLTIAGQSFSVTQTGTMVVLESLIVRDTPIVPIVQRPRT
jgi:Putative binding domain, N-terminal